MTLSIEDWKTAKAVFEKIKKQAEIDNEQADLYLEGVNKKILELEKALNKVETSS